MKSNDFDKETTTKAGETAESYVKNNFQDIETVEIEEVYQDPMGGMSVRGIVNDQPEFNLGMDEDDYTVQSIGVKHGFPDRKKSVRKRNVIINISDHLHKKVTYIEKKHIIRRYHFNNSYGISRRLFYEVQ